MCGICNVVRCIAGRTNGCGSTYNCGRNRREDCCSYNVFRSEPRMKIHCASGIGTASDYPCRTADDYDCGCRRTRDCD